MEPKLPAAGAVVAGAEDDLVAEDDRAAVLTEQRRVVEVHLWLIDLPARAQRPRVLRVGDVPQLPDAGAGGRGQIGAQIDLDVVAALDRVQARRQIRVEVVDVPGGHVDRNRLEQGRPLRMGQWHLDDRDLPVQRVVADLSRVLRPAARTRRQRVRGDVQEYRRPLGTPVWVWEPQSVATAATGSTLVKPSGSGLAASTWLSRKTRIPSQPLASVGGWRARRCSRGWSGPSRLTRRWRRPTPRCRSGVPGTKRRGRPPAASAWRRRSPGSRCSCRPRRTCR
jgi:hypothetical protein